MLRLAMAELLFHLGLLASTSILGAVSIEASRTISGAEDDWLYFCRSLAVLMSEHTAKVSQRRLCLLRERVGKDTSNGTIERHTGTVPTRGKRFYPRMNKVPFADNAERAREFLLNNESNIFIK